MRTLLANFESERKAFNSLLKQNRKERILLLRGESGSGKTTLLAYCTEKIPKDVKFIPIQLRETAVSVAEIFYRSANYLTWNKLTSFTKQVAYLAGTPYANINKNWLVGMGNHINVVMKVEDLKDRAQRSVELTHAWFEDLLSYKQTVLLLFDTYEKGNTEMQEWISGPLLSRVMHAPNVRVVIAGQDIPNKENIEWGRCCSALDLFGVVEAKKWMAIVKKMKRKIPVASPESWLAGVCYTLKGNPSKIMKVIEGLPTK